MNNEFQKFWSQTSNTNKLKTIKNTTDPWKTSEQLSRQSETILIRLRTGHSLLTHQHLFLKQPPPLCTNCNTPISIHHILIDCPLHHRARITHLKDNNLKNILSDNQIKVDNLIQFLKEIKLFNLI
jgi:hypothetical protein